MSSQEEKDKIAEQIIKQEREKRLERNGKICSIILMIIIFIIFLACFIGIEFFDFNVR